MTEPGQEPGMPPDDRELEEFLARRSELSRLHREDAQEQAPPELEAKVLETARAELRRPRPPRQLLRWDGPLALAASTLVVLGLAWLTQSSLEPTREEARAPVVAAMPAASAPAAGVPAEAAPQQQADKPQAPAAEPARKKRAAEPSARSAGPPARAVPPPSTMYGITQTTIAPDTSAAPRPQLQAPSPAPAADAVAEQAAPAMAAPPPEARDGAAEAQKSLPAPFPAYPAASAPMPAPPAPQPYLGAGQAYGRVAAARAKAAPDPCAAAQRAPAQRQSAPESRGDPAAWLEQIRTLRDTGTADAAKAELACYAARYPQAGVPDDLKPLLPAATP